MGGPLSGLRIVEVGGIGPVPFCGMLMADLGASVVRIERIKPRPPPLGLKPEDDVLNRGKDRIAVDLKHTDGVAAVLDILEGADALAEGFRPGVMERIGLGPADCLSRNPLLVYGRMTGWGQKGPLADTAGHDINYLAVSGILHQIGTEAQPIPPLNLVADFGGGAMYLVVGILSGILAVRGGGSGQVVDASMLDGASHLSSVFHGLLAAGSWTAQRRSNFVDGGAPFYDTYETSDGRHVAVGALEPAFYESLLKGLEIDPDALPPQMDRAGWPQIRATIEAKFRERSLAEWIERFSHFNACVSPVVPLDEARNHPHVIARGTYIELDGIAQPGPCPRFSETPAVVNRGPSDVGPGVSAILREWGMNSSRASDLVSAGVIRDPASQSAG